MRISAVIQIVIMVQRPQRIEPRKLAFRALLPVDPPEIHAVRFIRMVPDVKVAVDKFRVGNVEFHGLALFGVHAHGLSHFGIAVLKPAEAVRRMQVERDL